MSRRGTDHPGELKKTLASRPYPLYLLAFDIPSHEKKGYPESFRWSDMTKKEVCRMIYIDAHVHIHEHFALDRLLASARRNFAGQQHLASPGRPGTFFLLLTEAKNHDRFSDLKKQAEIASGPSPGGWRITATAEQESLLAVCDDWPENRLFIVAGHQIVTAERLEVLALATAAKVADHLPLPETVAEIRKQPGLAVLPWGAGKWLGKRGQIVTAFLRTADPERLFVGDNGGRPAFWPTPRQFFTAAGRGIRLLPGSDPLPLADEESRVGSYGAMIEGTCASDRPAEGLRTLLGGSGTVITPYGSRPGALCFFKTQIALRLE